MEQLNLIKKPAWIIRASIDDRTNKIIGYYKDSNIARVDAQRAGWYGSDGTVELTDIYEDSDGNIYEIKPKGRYVDVEREYENNVLNKIKSKLSDSELDFLGI